MKSFPVIRIEYDLETCTMTLSQHVTIDNLLKRFSMENCKPVSTPIEAKLKLEPFTGRGDRQVENEYQNLLGSLMYIMLATRPDLSFAVSYFTQFQSNHLLLI